MRHPIYRFLAELVVHTDEFDSVWQDCDISAERGVLVVRGRAFDFRLSSREEFAVLFNQLVEFGIPDPGDDDLRNDWVAVLGFIRVMGSHSCSKVTLACLLGDEFDIRFWSEIGQVFTANYMFSESELVRLRKFLTKRVVPALVRRARGDFRILHINAIEGLGNYLDRYDPLGRPLMAEMLRCLKLKVVPAVLVAVDED